MTATLLTLVNRVRVLLREEEITGLASTDPLTQALIDVVNGSMRRILDGYDWQFLIRHDGAATFRAPVTGTTITTATQDGTSIEVPTITDVATILSTGAWRWVPGSGATDASTSYAVSTQVTGGGATVFQIDPAWQGSSLASTTSAWEMFCFETTLPATVGQVLSCRYEQNPLQLNFAEEELDLDSADPRVYDSSGDPEVVTVGGYIARSGASPSRGTRIAVRPRPDARKIIHYTYRYKFADLSSATDTLYGVPDDVAELIVHRAFADSLMGNIENDPARAGLVLAQLERDLMRARVRTVADPLRRDVFQPFGGGAAGSPYRRWASRTVPTP